MLTEVLGRAVPNIVCGGGGEGVLSVVGGRGGAAGWGGGLGRFWGGGVGGILEKSKIALGAFLSPRHRFNMHLTLHLSLFFRGLPSIWPVS
jgi:hypothetical protein